MQGENKAIDAIAVVAVALVSVFGIGFLIKKSVEEAVKIERR